MNLYCLNLSLNYQYEVYCKKYFSEMNLINQELNFKDLSMGMSGDYMDAVKNSSTFVRVGSKIFGSRN